MTELKDRITAAIIILIVYLFGLWVVLLVTGNIPHKDTPNPIPVEQSKVKWQCHIVTTCPHVDWRYTDPKDVCSYQDVIINSDVNPTDGSYGESCVKI